MKSKRLYSFILTITHMALAILHQSCQKGLVEQPSFQKRDGSRSLEGGKLFKRKRGTPQSMAGFLETSQYPVDGNLQQSFSICSNCVAESIWNRHSHITSTLNRFGNTQVANAQQWSFTVVARLCLKSTSCCILHQLLHFSRWFFPGAASVKAN